MELLEVIQRTVGQYLKGSGLTDLTVGTVSGIQPLKITLEATRLEVGGEALWLTASVVNHSFPVSGGTGALDWGLKPGDRVLLLRVLGGQGFIILSRIFKEGS